MANDYLISKWKLWFKMYDTESTGQITREEAKREEEILAKLSHLEADQKQQFIKAADEVWDDIVFHGKPGPITEQEFVDAHNNAFKADKAKFVENMHNCYTRLIDLIDVSHEGSVTLQEMINAFKSIHHENIAIDKKLFESYNPVDGKIPSTVLVDSWLQFATCEDSSKPDLFKDALEAGI